MAIVVIDFLFLYSKLFVVGFALVACVIIASLVLIELVKTR